MPCRHGCCSPVSSCRRPVCPRRLRAAGLRGPAPVPGTGGAPASPSAPRAPLRPCRAPVSPPGRSPPCGHAACHVFLPHSPPSCHGFPPSDTGRLPAGFATGSLRALCPRCFAFRPGAPPWLASCCPCTPACRRVPARFLPLCFGVRTLRLSSAVPCAPPRSHGCIQGWRMLLCASAALSVPRYPIFSFQPFDTFAWVWSGECTCQPLCDIQ